MQAVLTGSDAKIRNTFTDADGAATVPTSPKVTIVRDSDGKSIETAQAATSEGSGVVSFTLDGEDIPSVDLLTATWSAGVGFAPVTEVAVVGGFMCSLEAIAEQIEAGGGENTPASAGLRALREKAEERLEHICGVAFRPSYVRETRYLVGVETLLLKRPRATEVLSVTLDGTDISEEVTLEDGCLRREDCGAMTGLLNIAYVHGWESCPDDMSVACAQLAAAYNESSSTAGISRFREDDQEFWLTVPGASGAETNLPDVNAAIQAYRYIQVA